MQKFEAARGVEEVSAMVRSAGHCKGSLLVNSPLLVLKQYQAMDQGEDQDNAHLIDSLETLMADSTYPAFKPIVPDSLLKERKKYLSSRLPKHWWLVHGALDKTVPFSSSSLFEQELRQVGVDARLGIYSDMNHADFMIDLFGVNERVERFLGDLKGFVERATEN